MPKAVEDLQTILREAEKAGTLARLKDVGIHFTEIEIRSIVRAFDILRQISDGYGPQHGSKWCRDMAADAFQ